MGDAKSVTAVKAAERYADLSSKLSLSAPSTTGNHEKGTAVRAKFVTPLDPVLETTDGNRLPAVPLREAHELNALQEKSEASIKQDHLTEKGTLKQHSRDEGEALEKDGNLNLGIPPLRTHPLFPPLPLYGPPSLLRNAQYLFLRVTSAFLSTGFLLVIVLGAVFTSVRPLLRSLFLWLTFRDPSKGRPFHIEEKRRAARRREEEQIWQQRNRRRKRVKSLTDRSNAPSPSPKPSFEPLEGGPDPLICNARYYARRVGLEMEKLEVQTEDGFIIDLWHVIDPSEQRSVPEKSKNWQESRLTTDSNRKRDQESSGKRRYPVLLIHGLLQSAGAYCCNDDDSLAFYLHKAGYDVWLGNNRCGFNPKHSLLVASDPRMWAWNIRQMGVMDLPAFVSRVLSETGFSKLGLVAHSQGTTQTFVAFAKEQVPELGEKISVFCALAPAVYAGPLIEKMYFKFMKVISPAMFRIFFGIHTFIPLMMIMHSILPGSLYGWMGYLVFGFLFNWSDRRWDRGLRNRFFQFAPVHVSAESMRWWLGRECFAKHKCVLSTGEEHLKREKASEEEEKSIPGKSGTKSWYDKRVPPFAIWVAGSDDLVDGRRLLQRFQEGEEPHVKLVHSKIIEEYEHLDVLWAIDSIEQVGNEVKQVIWQTISDADKEHCRPINGTE